MDRQHTNSSFSKKRSSFYPKVCFGFCYRRHAPSDACGGQASSSTVSFCIRPAHKQKQVRLDHTRCHVRMTVKDLYLASDPKATVQPHEPVDYRFYGLPLRLLHTVIGQASALLLCPTWKKSWHPKQRCQECPLHLNCKKFLITEHICKRSLCYCLKYLGAAFSLLLQCYCEITVSLN